MLYPIETQSRRVKNLNGIWSFQLDQAGRGEKDNWQDGQLTDPIPMPVPSSFNDITTQEDIRDFVGDAWYETSFYVHDEWFEENIFIRFGAVSHTATVYVNGKKIKVNRGGFLPFEIDVTKHLHKNQMNRLTVKVNNELSWDMLPPGKVVEEKRLDGRIKKRVKQQHDFFNYAGIHRSVFIYTKPSINIEQIRVNTSFLDDRGIVDVKSWVTHVGDSQTIEVAVQDHKGKTVSSGKGGESKLFIDHPRKWSPKDPYLYNLHITVLEGGKLIDHYVMKIGLRTVEISNGHFLLNGENFYLKGFGKHEDALIRGKGYDAVTTLRDFQLMKWSGANSFRTAHYPYAEEVLHLADEMGFLVIDETSAVGLLSQGVPATGELQPVFQAGKVSRELFEHHKKVLKELIYRDWNHPSVVMWSISNEASTMEKEAEPYFKSLIQMVRELDNRPVMNVNLMLIEPERCVVSKHCDVIGLNVYHGWYSTPGELEQGERDLRHYLNRWEKEFKLPILITEFGVDTIAGLHKLPPVMFSEEFQVEFLKTYQRVFDQMSYVCGEHVWNFADFMTKQDTVRVDGNKKGVFTRSREPKSAAFHLRQRWQEGVIYD
ncbi:beta-glucuronidase [Halobacillus sp. Nhm2S1]|uniref:beta-glucuronidase n=1 Tax=Halobacillus sp. Nhm2S1 TaxID=2866716 RepID=UPI001C730AEC|nr:beta-glucuronidase [Halobacillus sp. Nhm2S1]MBX0356843.1 beta-glucuronidase [Halobacillus sp. Nhm2S1]